MKVCKNCQTNKSVWNYVVSSNSDDGLFPICKSCTDMLHQNALKRYASYSKMYNGSTKQD